MTEIFQKKHKNYYAGYHHNDFYKKIMLLCFVIAFIVDFIILISDLFIEFVVNVQFLVFFEND